MSDVGDRFVGVGVAFVSALWTWVAFAATMALFSGDRAVRAILGPSASESAKNQVADSVPGYVEAFVGTLTFADRQSWVIQVNQSGWDLIGQYGGRSVKLVVVVLLLTVLIAGPLVLVSQIDLARPVVALIGLFGAAPALVWCLAVFHLASDPGSYLQPKGYGDMLVPGLTLALPLGLALARIASRYDATNGRETVRSVLLDGWPFVAWAPGALVLIELVFAVNGIFWLWFQALFQGDYPLFTLVSAVVVAPVVACAFLRDVGLALTLPAETTATSERGVAADGGQLPRLGPLLSALGRSRVAQAGAGLFGLLFVVGFVGSKLTERNVSIPADRTIGLDQIVHALGTTTTTGAIALVVAAAVGFGLGFLATHTGVPRHVNRLLDPVANVPVAVFLLAWLAYLEFPSGMTEQLVFGGLGGLAVAPLVARRVERAMIDGQPAAVISAAGLAASGAAIVVFVTVELAFLGAGPLDASFAPGSYWPKSVFWSHLAFVVLPAAALLVLGEGLRWADPTE